MSIHATHSYTLLEHVDPVVTSLTADREVRVSNPTLALHEFLSPQEMNLQGSIQPRCELVH